MNDIDTALSPDEIDKLVAQLTPTFADQVDEAIDELIEAKFDYMLARRAIGGEYANPDQVDKARAKLISLFGRIAA